jgi:hypothetical protein
MAMASMGIWFTFAADDTTNKVLSIWLSEGTGNRVRLNKTTDTVAGNVVVAR